jgi:NAD(P)-dependent dehydrogenase (short-subunit alcohol dehydrogenase family)
MESLSSMKEAEMVAVAGKVVVVTGGRRGLGAALVDEVLARGARKVYSTARAAYTDDRKEVVTHELEVRSPDSVAALAEIATDAEIVFNNAGVLLPESLLTGSFEHVTGTFDVNVFGPLRVTRAFAPILAANGGGAVVNMHSVLSWLGGAGAYGASKAAMWSVTNSLRAELERQNTQVVGVHAGFIDTDMVSAMAVSKMTPAEVAKRIVDGLEDGAVEVLTDDITINVKAALSGPVERLTFALAH